MKKCNFWVTCFFLLQSINKCICHNNERQEQEKQGNFWLGEAQKTLEQNLKLKLNENVAKNLIFFLGDGMGISTVTAARILQGQQNGRRGEENNLSFEKFPHVALVKTYNTDKQVPDSAGTATAFLCGVKTKMKAIGVDGRITVGNCTSSKGAEVSSILHWAQQQGKKTGFVTTTRITHASPAGLYAHTPHRDWEADGDMPKDAGQCKDIARQLMEDEPGRNIDVILGGGRGYFLPNSYNGSELAVRGRRKDGRDLIEEWKTDKIKRGLTANVVFDRKRFLELDVNRTDYILGLFDDDHMDYELDRDESQPSLTEMTRLAIQKLKTAKNGYYLFVEGGRIDHGNHDNRARYALQETIAFSEAIGAAVDLTCSEDTLIVVTADHSHVLTINGYPNRGNPILGKAGLSDVDKMPYTTLMYTNGPGFPSNSSQRANLTNVDTDARNFRSQVAVQLGHETHGGEDIAVYAKGPMSHLFQSVMEQNYIPHAMAYAACIGSNKKHCSKKPKEIILDKSTFYRINSKTSKSSAPKIELAKYQLSVIVFAILMLK